MGRPRIGYPLVVLVLVLAGASGCGDGHTRADAFRTRAGTICKRFRAQAERLPSPGSHAAYAEIERFAGHGLKLAADQRSELGRLKPPRRMRSRWTATLGIFDDEVASVRELGRAAADRDPDAIAIALEHGQRADDRADASLSNLGLGECGSP